MKNTYSIQPLQLGRDTFSFLDLLTEFAHPIYVELSSGITKPLHHRLSTQTYLIWYFMLHPKNTLNFYMHEEDWIRWNKYWKEAL